MTAAADYPARVITLIVPFPPGGVADIVARPVAEALGRELKQPVIVENKAGAGGGVGMAYAAKANADGYTLLLALSSISIIPEADKLFGRPPMYQMNQLRPIARFTADPTVLAVRGDAPWKTYKEFVDAARAEPGKLTFGSSGNYGTMHIPMEMLKADARVNLTHVPYAGAGPAIVGLLGGQVDAIASGPSSIAAHVKAGKIRPLAHWGTGPLAAMPDVPSLMELGVQVQFAQWAGLFVPAGTPEAIVQRLREAARIAAQDERVRMVLTGAGSPVQYLDAPGFQKYWDADAAKMAEVVKKIGKVD
ncbi:MAG: tripartite tricarboxylate transporter substrate binding protein [Betaproteobacteria bacterium]|nr:tripartite tricarboxylate transporter substrate binding protein [Betaproteobacteria bacterium]